MSGLPQPNVPGRRPASPHASAPPAPPAPARAEALTAAAAPLRGGRTDLGGATHEELRRRLGDPIYRVLGAALILVGAVLGKIFVLDVLAKARLHAGDLTIYQKPVMMAGMLPVLGLAMLVFGKQVEPYLRLNRKKLTAPQIAILILSLAPGMVLMAWFRSQLAELGYGGD